MRRFRPLLTLGLALTSGVTATALAMGTLGGESDSGEVRLPSTREVLVAVRDVAAGAVLKPEDVRTVSWPADAVPAGYLSDPELVLGRGVTLPLRANEPVLATKLVDSDAGGLQIQIPPGMRAVSVRVDEVIGVAGFIQPNARVDVLVTLSGTGDSPPTTRVVLQNVPTLAIGRSTGENVEPEAEEGAKREDPSVITLLVTPEQSEQLALAAAEGRVQLALRNPLDGNVASTRGATLASLARDENGARPAAAPAPAPRSAPQAQARRAPRSSVVEVLHGSNMQHVAVVRQP